MKKILFMVCGFVMFFLMVMNLYAAASHFSGPIVAGTKAQGDGANVATSAGEIFANGDIEADGDLNIAGATTLTGDVTCTGDVDINGSLLLDVTFVSFNSTLTVTQSGLVVSTGTAGFSLWLPTASGNAGLTYTIKLDTAPAVAVYAVTVEPLGAETIDGATNNAQINNWYDYITIVSDGDEWFITAEKEN